MTTGRAHREESSIIADFGPDRQLSLSEKGCFAHQFNRYCLLSRFMNAKSMSTPHKNKPVATFLALILGAVGAHRFYLRGSVDRLGLLHVTCLPIAGLVYGLAPQADWFYKILPILVSAVAGYIEALALGVMPDEKFDAAFNPGSGRKSDSSWVIAALLVATMMVGATVLIGTMSRLFDLLYTGGAYG
jgi:TM2 domain-containing membrane protein YozV